MQLPTGSNQGLRGEEFVGGLRNGWGRLMGKIPGRDDLEVHWSGWVHGKRIF